jgi:hypothetical protein
MAGGLDEFSHARRRHSLSPHFRSPRAPPRSRRDEFIFREEEHKRATLLLNGWLALTLLVLGPHNLPLAAPAFFNVGYQLHSRRAVGWAIVGAAIAVNVGLFIGSLIFLASGQSFEQFRGM